MGLEWPAWRDNSQRRDHQNGTDFPSISWTLFSMQTSPILLSFSRTSSNLGSSLSIFSWCGIFWILMSFSTSLSPSPGDRNHHRPPPTMSRASVCGRRACHLWPWPFKIRCGGRVLIWRWVWRERERDGMSFSNKLLYSQTLCVCVCVCQCDIGGGY